MKKTKPDFSAMSKKQILEYIWDYYKWCFIVAILAIGILVNVVYTNITAKDFVLRGVFINSTGADAGEIIEQDFLEYSGIDTAQENVFFDTNCYLSNDMHSAYAIESHETLQVLNAKLIVGEIDFILGDLSIMNDMAYRQYFGDLSGIVNEDLLEQFKPYLLYYDKAILQDLGNVDVLKRSEDPISYPDPQKPELMQDPIPIFVDVSSCTKLQELYPYDTNECVIAFTINGSNTEKVLEFIEFLMNQGREVS